MRIPPPLNQDDNANVEDITIHSIVNTHNYTTWSRI